MANRVLVCGGRDMSCQDYMDSFMDGIHDAEPVDIVIHGGARGADSLAESWAKSRHIHTAVVNAQWTYGYAAGPLRNAAMLLLQPSLVVAFPGGVGTASMVSKAKKAGIPVIHTNGV